VLLAHLVLASAAFAASPTLQAATAFEATLTNAQENPPVTPTTAGGLPRSSSGTATLVLNDAQTALSFEAVVFGIDVTGLQTADPNDNLLSAHIHASATSVPGVNGPVVFGFFGAPFNDTNPNDMTLVPFASGVGGTFRSTWNAPEGNNTTLTAQLGNLLAGRAYLNFHTVQFSGGEIRGQIVTCDPGARDVRDDAGRPCCPGVHGAPQASHGDSAERSTLALALQARGGRALH
jgi:hypothetical protein